jgi:hypothetical protein
VGEQPNFVGAWLPGGLLVGFGMGLTYPMIGSACVREVSGSDLSVASASNRMTLQIGNAIGIALVIAILGDSSGHALEHPMRVAWAVTAVIELSVTIAMALLHAPAHIHASMSGRTQVVASR